MDAELLLKGTTLGFAIAAPIGPVGTLCIERVLRFGFLTGICAGLGTALADSIYGLAGAMGVIAALNSAGRFSDLLKGIGGLLLVYLGAKSIRTPITGDDGKISEAPLLRVFTTTLVLTLANPATILSFMAIFAGIGLSDFRGTTDTFVLIFGIFVGSMCWWVLLSALVSALRKRISSNMELGLRVMSASVLVYFGASSLYSLFSNPY